MLVTEMSGEITDTLILSIPYRSFSLATAFFLGRPANRSGERQETESLDT
jgi:hypothetical protein